MIGGSRTESHISACAVSHVERGAAAGGASGEDFVEDDRPAYHDCEPIPPTQLLEEDTSDAEEEGESETYVLVYYSFKERALRLNPSSSSDSNIAPLTHMDGSAISSGRTPAVMRGNAERVVKDGDCTFFYGQTPSIIRRRDFERFGSKEKVGLMLTMRFPFRLADYMDMSVEEAAKFVLDTNDIGRAELLKVA